MELQEEINNISKNYICTFNNTLVKFAVYIVKSCGPMLVLQDVNNFLETFFFQKKVSMLIWIRSLEKVLQQQCLWKKRHFLKCNFLKKLKKVTKIFFTKNNFKEVEEFHVSSWSGSYTLGTLNIFQKT